MNYEWRTVSVNVGQPVGAAIKIFGPNSRRVALQVYSANNVFANTVYTLNDKNVSTNYWAIRGIPSFDAYPYRDFGPVIQAELWLLCYDINAVWSLTEVFVIN